MNAWLSKTYVVGLLAVVCGAMWGAIATAQDNAEAPAEAAVQGSAASWSADLPVVSDGRHAWLWADQPSGDDPEQRVTVLYHADAAEYEPEEGPAWEKVTEFAGRLSPRGAAAEAGTLWLMFDNGQVAMITLRPAPIEGDWYFRKHASKSLPAGTTVRSSAAADGKLWALVRVETGQAILDLDRGPTEAEAAVSSEDLEPLNLVLGLPRDLVLEGDDPFAGSAEEQGDTASEETAADPQAEGDDAETSEPQEGESESDASAPASEETEPEAQNIDGAADEVIEEAVQQSPELPEAPADRLLVLDRGAWRVVPLPDAWESNRPVQVIAPSESESSPVLLLQGEKFQAGREVTLYRAAAALADGQGADDASAEVPLLAEVGPRWKATSLTLAESGGVTGLRVAGQLVLAQHQPTSTGFAARLSAVRGDQLIAIGGVALDASTDTPAYGVWIALPFGDSVGVLAGERDTAAAILQRSEEKPLVNPAPGPTVTTVNLHGQTDLAPMRMDVDPERPLSQSADTIILMGVVVVSMLLLFAFWRRDPTANTLQLAEGDAIADLMRRGFAGLIDLAPGLLVATSVYGLPFEELYDRWPGRGVGATWEKMLPGLTAIGVVVAHTLALEAATGRSLGKWVAGLRVTTLVGETPKFWQYAVRGLLKAFDLIAFLLLIFPVISPYRQRLGDMVAGTVVVMKAPPSADDSASGGDA
ncbi:RDD family protein [Algisphaera agarilytica]|uniref:Putative RDD family membrane protein YckC n=1 Tax=Algisphaera agarilytica TaxID=1385975 RepID=A0A7X0H6J2_9BACT|nr:RDD family protein [Algisphaera agarilytica]MBB6428709.1 putative RDD family membrane protein YckC [Algisphaera agarilytica]